MNRLFNELSVFVQYSVEDLKMLKSFLRDRDSAYVVKTLLRIIDILIYEKEKQERRYEGRQTQFDNIL